MDTEQPTAFEALRRNAGFLLVIALVTTAALAATSELTQQRIDEQRRAARQAVLLELIGDLSAYDNDPLNDVFQVADSALGYTEPRRAYRLHRDGAVRLVILPLVAPDGYSGAIDMLIGIDDKERISGLRVTGHRETPGLGDKLELRKSPWILDFNERALGDPPPPRWAVKRDGGAFDQFTGATVTPRAVVAAVRRALEYTRRRHEALFAGDRS